MAIYYLDELDGDDANSGLSPDKAFKTYERLYAEIPDASIVKEILAFQGDRKPLDWGKKKNLE